jgi:hypothetical protein
VWTGPDVDVTHFCATGDANVIEVRKLTFPGTATVGDKGVIVAVGDVAGEFVKNLSVHIHIYI